MCDKSIRVSTAILFGICLSLRLSAQTTTVIQDQNKIKENNSHAQPGKIYIDCPKDVRIGFKNTPGGWQESIGGGIGMLVPFAEVMVDGSTITCIYRDKGDVKFFMLHKKVPPGYKCEVGKMNDSEKYNRTVVCTAAADRVIPLKKN